MYYFVLQGIGCDCSPFWTYLYWITTALTLSSSMHVLICSVYISVYGQGLALRGPLGSMVSSSALVVTKFGIYCYPFSIAFFSETGSSRWRHDCWTRASCISILLLYIHVGIEFGRNIWDHDGYYPCYIDIRADCHWDVLLVPLHNSNLQ